LIKGLVSPKTKILSVITHPHVVPTSNPVRISFIFRTQIKIFFDEIWELAHSFIGCKVVSSAEKLVKTLWVSFKKEQHGFILWYFLHRKHQEQCLEPELGTPFVW